MPLLVHWDLTENAQGGVYILYVEDILDSMGLKVLDMFEVGKKFFNPKSPHL
jgi:hypothetical protein